MTNEELLQQVKDHAAWKTCGWTSFREAVQQCDPVTLRQIMDEAIKIAIQRAREEAWIDVDHLPERGEQVLLLCPTDDKKGFFQCVGFYAREKEVEAWTDDDDTPGIDYDVEAGITWLTEGFYTEEEQYRGECDSHYFERHPVKWRKLTAPGR